MGMFDELAVSCPNCGSTCLVHSKAGPCILKIYTEADVPATVAEDVNGSLFCCDECGSVNVVDIQSVSTTRVTTQPYLENEDE